MVAPPPTGKATPPVPHVAVNAEAAEPEKPVPAPPPKRRRGRSRRLAILSGVAVLVLGGGGFFAFRMLTEEPPPPPPKAKAKAPAPSTPQTTAEKLAQTPKNAINKAQEVVTTKREGTQATTEVLASDSPAAKAANQPAPKAATTMTSVAPGVSASTKIEAAPEASPAFRSFIASVRVSGVFQGTPARAVINGKLTQQGDTVDSLLGITFEGVDTERRMLVFKDKSGATASRKYP